MSQKNNYSFMIHKSHTAAPLLNTGLDHKRPLFNHCITMLSVNNLFTVTTIVLL